MILTRQILASWFLFLALVLPVFVPAGFVSAIMAGFCVLVLGMAGWTVHPRIFKITFPFLILLVVGALHSFSYPLWDVLKDGWYVGKVVIELALGFLLYKCLRGFRKIVCIVLYAAAFAATFHLIEIGLGIANGASILELREGSRIAGNLISVVGLVLIITFRNRAADFPINNWLRFGIALLCSVSMVVSLSRTSFIFFLVLFIVCNGWAKLKFSNLIRVSILGAIVAVSLVIIESGTGSDYTEFADKVSRSIQEIAIKDYEESSDINVNWRGFESYQAMTAFMGGSIDQKILGQGLGAKVDLGFYMLLGGTELRFIPVLHNGYMYLLLKFGIVGLLVYLGFLSRLIFYESKYLKRESFEEVYVTRFVAGLGWCFLVTTLVISGVFNKSELVAAVVLVGVALGYLNTSAKRLRAQVPE